jgi:protein-tyrosine kinase
MELLHQALEQFKQLPRDSPTSRNSGRGALGNAPPPIVYSRTKVMEIPEHEMRRRRIVAGFEGGPFVEGYKLLRTQVLHRLRENGWNVLGITSPNEHEGKTLTAVNLAVTLAMEATQTVLLVDADLRRPSIHRMFGLDRVKGLADVLLDEVPLDETLIHPGIGRFVILPGGRKVPRPAEALTSPHMAALVDEMKHRYESRIVLFDLPPVLASADVLAFGPFLDALLLVASEGVTRRHDVEESIQRLKGAVPILGTLLNQVGRGNAGEPAAMAPSRHRDGWEV